MIQLILYSKPGCHLCEGLQEKLEQIQELPLQLEIRDITTNTAWFQAYQYEVPVLLQIAADATEKQLPRPSPRLSVEQLQKFLHKSLKA
ncbi:MAG: glutaredoxin family protein [Cyanobacteria bacterium P01_A01_bin.17]